MMPFEGLEGGEVFLMATLGWKTLKLEICRMPAEVLVKVVCV